MKIYRFLASTIVGISLCLVGYQSAFAQGNSGGEQGSGNGQPFQTLQSQIDMLNANFDATVAMLQSQIDDLVASQADQDDVIAAIEAAANLLQARVAANEGDIAALQAAQSFQDQLIAALQTNLAALEARVTVNEGDIAAIILADQAMQALIGAIQTQIANLTALINNSNAAIGSLQSQIASLSDQLAFQQADLAAKQDRVAGVCNPTSSIRRINSDGSVVCDSGVRTLQRLTVVASAAVPTAALPFGFLVVGSVTKTAFCPSTHVITGGGYEIIGAGFVAGIPFPGNPRAVHVAFSRPLDPTAWEVSVSNANIVVFDCCRIILKVFASCTRNF